MPQRHRRPLPWQKSHAVATRWRLCGGCAVGRGRAISFMESRTDSKACSRSEDYRQTTNRLRDRDDPGVIVDEQEWLIMRPGLSTALEIFLLAAANKPPHSTADLEYLRFSRFGGLLSTATSFSASPCFRYFLYPGKPKPTVIVSTYCPRRLNFSSCVILDSA